MKKTVTLLTFFLLTLGAMAQTKQVDGVVVDEKGIEVIGASVLVKGTTQGTITDIDGQFVLTVDKDATTLVVSYMGYQTQEVAITGKSLRIVLKEDTKLIEEVVVTGYSNVSKGSFAGSAQSVSSETIEKKTPTDISKAMAGEVAGVQVINSSGQPGINASIRIRGIGSINASTSPLYVVDGMTYGGDISSIDPNDIATYTVLKDGTAAALYGSRGANGVIVITTKRGKKDDDAKIDVDVTYGANMHLLPMYDVITSPEEYVEMSWQALYNRHNSANIASQYLFDNRNGIPKVYNLWDAAGEDLIDPETGKFNSTIQRLAQYKNMQSWEDAIFRTGQRANASVRIQGGNQKVSYFSSFAYTKDEGYYIASDFDRFSTRNNIDFQAKSWLKGSLDLAYTYYTMNNPGQSTNMNNGFAYVNEIPPIYPVYEYDEDGNIRIDPKTGEYMYDYGMHQGYGRSYGSGINPAGSLRYDKNRTKVHQVSAKGNLEFKLYKELKLDVTAGMDYIGYNTASLTNKFYGDAGGIGRAVQKQSHYTLFETKQILKYNTQIDDHVIDVFGGHELSYTRSSYLGASMSYIANPYNVELDNSIKNDGAGSSSDETAMESFLAQGNYTYKERYMLNATYRTDGSSKFSRGHRWGHFGSVGVAWKFTEEDFVQPITEYIKDGKLRLSWSMLGNQGIDSEYFQDHYGISYYQNQVATIWNFRGTSDITWERSQMYDLGLEFSVSKYLDLDLDYFYKLTDNLLLSRVIPSSMGYSSIWINGGELENHGFEFQGNIHAIDMRNIKLDLRFNGGFYRNKLLKLPMEFDGKTEMTTNGGYAKGHSMAEYQLVEYMGVDPENGHALYKAFYDADKGGFGTKDANLVKEGETQDNHISNVTDYRLKHPNANIKEYITDSVQYCGYDFIGKSYEPDLDGGFGMDFEAYGVTLSVNCSYRIGGYGIDYSYATLMGDNGVGSYNWHVDMRNAWTEDNRYTDVPLLTSGLREQYTNATTTRFLTSNSYISLNNIRLGYNFQKKLLEKIKLSKLEVYMQADNLAIASARKGYNPMVSFAGSSSTYRYTPLSTVIGGIKLQF